jgi:rubrerythrin
VIQGKKEPPHRAEEHQKQEVRAMKKPAETSEEFLKIIREWQALEDKTIRSAEELIKKGKNPLITMTMEMIRHDSGKHKAMLQMVIDNLTKEAVHLNTDELSHISALLNNHMEVEAKSIALANDSLKKSELAITRSILSALLEDETKHHSQLHTLIEELKKSTIFIS